MFVQQEPKNKQCGVLALQGDFEPHAQALAALGQDPILVRKPSQLQGLSHLILPGGESTTMAHLLLRFGLWQPLLELHAARKLTLFGTCAGAILLGRDTGERPPRLALLDALVQRNAYGRQLASFSRAIPIPVLGKTAFPCIFIRAPKIGACGPGLHVLAQDGDDPILVQAPGVLAATFHPELTTDLRLHAYFLEITPDAQNSPSRTYLPSNPRNPEPGVLR